MSLLTKLKRALGFGSGADRETPVAVEQERPGSRDGGGETASTAGARESAAAGSTGVDGAPTGSTVDSTPDEDTASPAAVDDTPLTAIKGIGPAYAERLESAGVGTVGELAGADADALADATDISAKRIQGWIDRAAAQA